MPSKKDKLQKAAQDRLKKDPSTMQDVVADIENDRDSRSQVEKQKEERLPEKEAAAEMSVEDSKNPADENQATGEQPAKKNQSADPEQKKSKSNGSDDMGRTRDSIYNVSSDIRLEDYIESDNKKGPARDTVVKAIIIAIVFLFLGFGAWKLAGILFAPDYILSISTEELRDANVRDYAGIPEINLPPGAPIHIRFQWPEGRLEADYLRILIERQENSTFTEEAVLGRRPPRTASYIYFMGPLDRGNYRITVQDSAGRTLKQQNLRVN